ncbi:unnamed protein product, partial [Arabidopsis halleri]
RRRFHFDNSGQCRLHRSLIASPELYDETRSKLRRTESCLTLCVFTDSSLVHSLPQTHHKSKWQSSGRNPISDVSRGG